MHKVVTFGEIMMRLNPAGYLRLSQADTLEVSYAGGEANVAVAVAQMGMPAAFVTKVPDNDLGENVIREMRRWGVDASQIRKGGPRLGVYFVEKGASQRASKVIYDRAGSSIALAQPGEFDWKAIFAGADWFHFTGITPALGDGCAQLCMEAVLAAKAAGLTVSCDLNYRKKLWSREKAGAVMSPLMSHVDVCIANESDAADVFGIQAAHSDVEAGQLDTAAYEDVARQIAERFGCSRVAITLRQSISASVNVWGGMLYEGGKAHFSPSYTVQIVDRVGGGDSFAGGLVYALNSGYDAQKAVNFAAAASCLKHTLEHDFNLVSLDEVLSLMGGNASGRVQR